MGIRPMIISVSRDSHLWPLRDAVLATSGYAVSPATTISRALDLLEGRHYAAAVLGHSLTRDEKMEFVAKRNSRVPVLCISIGSGDCCGADVELVSPDRTEVLLSALARMIANWPANPQLTRDPRARD